MTMSLDEAIRTRRSVRGFLPQAVPEATLREVFELAQWAPSNCNVQPWMPHVVSGASLEALREALVAAGVEDRPIEPDWPADGVYPGVYRERQVEAARALYGAMGVERHDREGRRAAYVRNHAFFGAPHVVFIFMHRPFDTREATDLGMYAQTLMLALSAHGVGSCPQTALSFCADAVRAELGVASHWRLVFGISIGYEDPADPANACRIPRAVLTDTTRFVD